MKDIKDIISRAKAGENVIGELRSKSVTVRPWSDLRREYDPMLHPVMDRSAYPDTVLYQDRVSETETDQDGNPKVIKVPVGQEKVSRITYDLQRLAVKRVTELCFGIPVKRIYRPEDGNERQEKAAKYLEAIFRRARIDSVNIERSNRLYASCEVMTMWYAIKGKTSIYGFESDFKLRCMTYSPMQGDTLYPLFDDSGDLVALSVGYTRRVEDTDVTFFDTYTADTHLRWSNRQDGGGNLAWGLEVSEDIAIGKIPAVYRWRPSPAWEQSSGLVEEMEWAMSRNGNYLRKNSRPILAAFVSESLDFGQAPGANAAARDVVQYPAGSSLQYITWNQAIDNLKFYVSELRSSFFSQLQLPDWNYEKMSQQALSGESRKQLFIDAHLKVKDESGAWLEFFDREVNVVKAFLKMMLPQEWGVDIDALRVDIQMTPYIIEDRKEDAELLLLKNGNKPLMSQKESIRALGESEDVDATYEAIREETQAAGISDALGLAV